MSKRREKSIGEMREETPSWEAGDTIESVMEEIADLALRADELRHESHMANVRAMDLENERLKESRRATELAEEARAVEAWCQKVSRMFVDHLALERAKRRNERPLEGPRPNVDW